MWGCSGEATEETSVEAGKADFFWGVEEDLSVVVQIVWHVGVHHYRKTGS